MNARIGAWGATLLAACCVQVRAMDFHSRGADGMVWKAADGAYFIRASSEKLHSLGAAGVVWKAADGAFMPMFRGAGMHKLGPEAVLLKANDMNQPELRMVASAHAAESMGALWKAAGGAYEEKKAGMTFHTLGGYAVLPKANDRSQPMSHYVSTRHSWGADGTVWKAADGAYRLNGF